MCMLQSVIFKIPPAAFLEVYAVGTVNFRLAAFDFVHSYAVYI
jgi:hypothetical protein